MESFFFGFLILHTCYQIKNLMEYNSFIFLECALRQNETGLFFFLFVVLA